MIKAYNKNEVGLGDLGNIRRLVYFVAVVETGSFTAAAERLGITKTVVSQQVARFNPESPANRRWSNLLPPLHPHFA